jgi:hypothetical protein
MHRRLVSVALSLALALLGSSAGAATFVETFDGGGNTGGWTFGASEVIAAAGGNPGAFLHVTGLDTFAPQPRTSAPSLFTGDFRANGVTQFGVDLVTLAVDFSAEGRPLTLMLVSDNGTPADPDDDWAAYLIGPTNVPLPGQGWRSYLFDVPSQETSLPAGWLTLALGPNAPPTPDWNLVITDVTQVCFFYGDPQMFFIFQMWELGLDNPTIVGDTVPVELLRFSAE